MLPRASYSGERGHLCTQVTSQDAAVPGRLLARGWGWPFNFHCDIVITQTQEHRMGWLPELGDPADRLRIRQIVPSAHRSPTTPHHKQCLSGIVQDKRQARPPCSAVTRRSPWIRRLLRTCRIPQSLNHLAHDAIFARLPRPNLTWDESGFGDGQR